ncbi:MAG: hypothetical protein DRG78_08385 [Epsilonproteobacteria bacterium]|nr:MAG: hypothetical protein DRG78_08385 [Campylobacterota bacterium]
MYIPEIPSVTTSVIDRSTIDIVINGDRTILLPIFSKYGKEDFVRHSSIPEFKYSLGREDLKKYGKGYSYGILAAQTDNVITYRLLPTDASYANNVIRENGEFKSYPGISNKDQMTYTPPLAGPDGIGGTGDDIATSVIDEDVVLSSLATARGEGYNSIFVTFKPATAHEKMDSDVNGETNYKFNFVQAEVYEETTTGIKSLGDPVVFSLIEVDAFTNDPITDKISGANLFVNTIFKDANEFATININDKYTQEMSEFATIDDLVTNRLIIEDRDTVGKYYEVKIEEYNEIVKDDKGVNQKIPSQRLTTVIVNDAPEGLSTLKYTNTDDVELGKQIVIVDSVITFEVATAFADTPTSFKLDGEEAYYKLIIDENGIEQFTSIEFLRHSIYTKLMDYSIKLYSGTDGENLHVNSVLNMVGISEEGKENASQLILDFYNNTDTLREVLYPRLDFDYIPDWTENFDVCASIINLADDIGLSLPILSMPLTYNPTIVTKDLSSYDIKSRREKLFQSSYNSALYSGQMNKTHRTENNNRIYMPLSYYALGAHLRIDNQFSITEPVANMIKGTLDSTELNLTFAPTSLEIESMRNVQINTVIVEPDGTYIIDQLTMYKKASKLSRINIVKVIHRIRKDLPRLLKDLLQTKAIGSVIDTAVSRTEKELNKWIITPENTADGIFQSANVKADFNEETYKLRLTITVNPVGTLESIDIPIIVV